MRRPKRILFPTDFSSCSKRAEAFVIAWAQAFKADIYLLHVFDVPFYSHAGVSAGVYADVHLWIQDMRENELKRFHQIVRTIESKGLKVRPLFLDGKAPLEIVIAAKKFKVDLLVLGTHGRTGVRHMVLGSVAEKVVRESPFSVLTIRP